jgi:hypothetical protein
MKHLLSAHWEKLLLGFATLLVGISAVWNLVLAQEPAAAIQSLTSIQDLDGLLKKSVPAILPVPNTLEEVQRRLRDHPGTFPIPKDLLNYEGGTSKADYPMMEGTSKTIPLSEAATDWDIKGRECVSVQRGAPEVEDPKTTKSLIVEARQPGTVTITLKFYTKPAGSITVIVKPKSKIELWPPVLQGAQVSPTNPGEVTLNWTDHRNTSFGMTLGYVILRRVLPDGAFQPILGAGKMLPPGTTSYVDVAEPAQQYEYRVIAVGDPSVTHVMPQPQP